MPAPFKPRGCLLGNTSPTKLSSEVRASMQASVQHTGELVLVKGYNSTPISNQGGAGSCVANAVCDALEICRAQEGAVQQLSRRALYSWSRASHGENHNDTGTYIHSALTVAQNIGVAPEESWPYYDDAAHINQDPPSELVILAADNKITGFHQVDDEARVDIVELCLRGNQPCVFAMLLPKEYANPAPDKYIVDLVEGNEWGWHAQVIVGMTTLAEGTRLFLVRNSWGSDWCDQGYCWISDKCLAHPTRIQDVFALTTMKELVL